MKARTVAGRGKKSPLSDPGSELGLGRKGEKEMCEDIGWDDQKQNGACMIRLCFFFMSRSDKSPRRAMAGYGAPLIMELSRPCHGRLWQCQWRCHDDVMGAHAVSPPHALGFANCHGHFRHCPKVTQWTFMAVHTARTMACQKTQF